MMDKRYNVTKEDIPKLLSKLEADIIKYEQLEKSSRNIKDMYAASNKLANLRKFTKDLKLFLADKRNFE